MELIKFIFHCSGLHVLEFLINNALALVQYDFITKAGIIYSFPPGPQPGII